MSERNFIGKQLINIKDRIAGRIGCQNQVQQKTSDTETVFPENVDNQPEIQKEPELKQDVLIEPVQIKKETKEILPSAFKLDKEYIKALQSKREDYLRTKGVVTKILGDTLTGLKKEIGIMEQREKMYSDSADLLKRLLKDISGIEEAKWNSNDFSIELSEAERILEKARLENIILKERLNLKAMEESKNDCKNGFSILDVVSLSFSQVFKLGFGFFLPLIIGVVVAALIVAVTMLVSMGTL